MNKDEKMLPQELHNKVKEGTASKTANNVEANLEDNDIQVESSIIVGKATQIFRQMQGNHCFNHLGLLSCK